MTKPFKASDIERALAILQKGPIRPDKEFIRGGATFSAIYRLAASIQQNFAESPQPPGVVCLAAEDKSVIAAALLAGLGGAPSFVLPYAFSANALMELQKATGFATAIVDTEKEFPAGILQLVPELGTAWPKSGFTGKRPKDELLRIFTGGSTGTPQIWSKTVENMFCEAFHLADRFQVGEFDTILATIPPYHIYGLLFSVLLPLVSGASVIAASPSYPSEIVDMAAVGQATILASIPVHYRMLHDQKMALRLAFSSAGMLDPTDNTTFSENNRYGIIEVYGSTETGGIATRNRARGEQHFTPFSLLDWKIENTRLAVRSPYISPELPLDPHGFFLTSDRVEKYSETGFALVGRVDSITKVGGKRVDLDQVASLIKSQTGVVDCLVLALPEDGGRGNRIGAVIEGAEADLDQIRKALIACLEPYALPRFLKKIDKIPMTKSGKYDRQTIRQLLEK